MKRHIARGAFVAASLMTTLAFAAPADAAGLTTNGLASSTAKAVAAEHGAVTLVGGRYYGRRGFHGGFRHRGFYGGRHFGHRGFGYRRHGFYGHRGYYGHRKFYGHGFKHRGFKRHGFKYHGHKGHSGKFFFGFKH